MPALGNSYSHFHPAFDGHFYAYLRKQRRVLPAAGDSGGTALRLAQYTIAEDKGREEDTSYYHLHSLWRAFHLTHLTLSAEPPAARRRPVLTLHFYSLL